MVWISFRAHIRAITRRRVIGGQHGYRNKRRANVPPRNTGVEYAMQPRITDLGDYSGTCRFVPFFSALVI